MSALLISFCYTRPLGHVLGRIDTDSDAFEWVDLSSIPVPVYGATGLVRTGSKYYVALQVRIGDTYGTQLVELDDHARVLRSATLPGIQDAHSLVAWRDELLLVASATNQVFAISWANGESPALRVFYEQDPGSDTLHMNSILAFDDRVYLSMFGKRSGDDWHRANDGQVLDLNAGGAVVLSGLRHPHSLFVIDDTLMCVNSRGETALRVDGAQRPPVRELAGYLRGACAANGELYIGASMARRRSKSRGTAYGPATPAPQSNLAGSPEPADARALSSAAIAGDGCGLHVLAKPHDRAPASASRRWLDLSPFGPELYDVIAWHGIPVRGSRATAMIQRLRAVNGEFTDLASVWSRLLLQRLHVRELARALQDSRTDLPEADRILKLAREIERFW